MDKGSPPGTSWRTWQFFSTVEVCALPNRVMNGVCRSGPFDNVELLGGNTTKALPAGPELPHVVRVTSNGQPSAGRSVTAGPIGNQLTGVTDSNGEFRFTFIPTSVAATVTLAATCSTCTNTATKLVTVTVDALPPDDVGEMCPAPGTGATSPVHPETGTAGTPPVSTGGSGWSFGQSTTEPDTGGVQASGGGSGWSFSGSGWGGGEADSGLGPQFAGNPINVTTGEKVQTTVDWRDAGTHPLSFIRHYRSYGGSVPAAGLGEGWSHNWIAFLSAQDAEVRIEFGSGMTLVFLKQADGSWRRAGSTDSLVPENDGWTYTSGANGGAWRFSASGMLLSISQRNRWTYQLHYAASGQLLRVQNAFGRELQFAYDPTGRLVSVSAPDGTNASYGYDASARLSLVTYPGGGRSYLYEDGRWPKALTGILDETGQRLATFGYDDAARAVLTEHAGGAQRYTVTYGAPAAQAGSVTTGAADPAIYRASSVVTTPNGAQQVYSWQGGDGVVRLAGTSAPIDGSPTASRTFGSALLVESETDFLGVQTMYTWDVNRRLKLSVTRAANRLEAQSVQTQWHPVFRLPALVTRDRLVTAYNYDDMGRLTSTRATDMATGEVRTTTRTYNQQGLLESVADARGGVWRYAYDAHGNLARVINPAGQETTTVYDAAGRMVRSTEPSGRTSTFAYDSRGRLTALSVAGETTTYAYTATGQVSGITFANGYSVSYTYDAAQRLVALQDTRGASITYVLDAAGNRTREEVKDASGQLASVTSRVFDALGKLTAVRGASGQTTQIAYDANGVPVSVTDPLNQSTRQTLDGLQRVTATTFPDNTAATQGWNVLDQLTRVSDPKGVATLYTHNAFGEVMSESSPDIGTIRYTRDAAGAVVAIEDAKGQITRIERDALGRPAQIVYAQGAPAVFTYDAAGHLLELQDASGITRYARDAQGRVVSKTQTLNDNPGRIGTQSRVSYSYAQGDLTTIEYPSGMKVTYRREAGRVSAIDVQLPRRSTAPFVSGVAYTALGQPKAWRWASGDVAERSFDTDGRMTATEFASYTYDAASRITGVTQQLWARKLGMGPPRLEREAVSWSAEYDSRNRLVAFTRQGAETRYTYDSNSNRLTSVESSGGDIDLDGSFDVPALTYSTAQTMRIEPGSNRLLGFTQTLTATNPAGHTLARSGGTVTYTIDANGSLTSDGLRNYEYDAAGRLSKVTVRRHGEAAAVTYLHNAQGQRVFKSEARAERTEPSEDELGSGFINWLRNSFGWLFERNRRGMNGDAFVYADGQLPAWALLGEYGTGGANSRGTQEYIWLPVDGGAAIPIGIHRAGDLYAIHADHLGTPRLVTDERNRPVWQWPYSAFGSNEPTGPLTVVETRGVKLTLKRTAPDIEMNLRFPGQYFDSESKMAYNYFRSYMPGQGRYAQADPTGLLGGLNRYSYVGGEPMSNADPLGLWRNPSDIYDDALRDARTSGLPGAHNGLQDAYRHCLASCEMARENGHTAAQCLGWANEKRGDWWRNQETGERQMDDFNNSVGFGFGRSAQSYQACQSACMNAATTGGLRTYTPGTSPGYWY